MKKLFTLLLLCLSTAYNLSANTVDTLTGNTAPKEYTRNYKKLSHYLCDGLPDDKAKANAIYNWVTHNIAYDAKALQKGTMKHEKATSVFKNRRGVCEGYSKLITAMCEEAGVTALTVDGYSKDWMFDNGDKLYIPRHSWNAFFADGNWYLMDATWGAGGLGQKPGWIRMQLNKISKHKVYYSKKLRFEYHYDPQYFMQDATAFRIKHLPLDPMWQLADTAMPIQVFEGGAKSIMQFNEQYGRTEVRNPYLNQLGMLSEMQRTYESADRAHAYNERFPMIMAEKHELVALESVHIAMLDSNRDYSNLLFTEARGELKSADGYIAAQKKNIAAEYSALKKKNKTKNAAADKSIRTIRNDNKRLTAQCNSRIRTAENKYHTINTKYSQETAKSKKVNSAKIASIKTALKEKDSQSPELKVIQDSLASRAYQIAALKAQIAKSMAKGTEDSKQNKAHLDALAGYLQIADSALVNEAIERIRMHDNYDDEVIAWNELLKKHKYELADSFQKKYYDNYDTVIAGYESQKKLQGQLLSLHQKNLRELEQYKRYTSTNSNLDDDYKSEVAAYQAQHAHYLSMLADYAGYVKDNKGLFTGLIKVYKRQDKITDYMAKAESRRKTLEEKYIGKKQAFDEKENAAQKQSIVRTNAKADKLYAKLTGGKKKRASKKV